MINIKDIGYRDDVIPNYKKDIDSADTLEKLKLTLSYWKPLAEDAYKLVQSMTESEFNKFREGLAKERKGIFSENEQVMVILMPLPMTRISIMAIEFKVPFGCVLHRILDEGVLEQFSK